MRGNNNQICVAIMTHLFPSPIVILPIKILAKQSKNKNRQVLGHECSASKDFGLKIKRDRVQCGWMLGVNNFNN